MTPPHEESGPSDGGSGDDQVSFSVTIEGEETVIEMRGDRDTAVVVRSASGERIYLPPEDFDRDTPREGGGSGRSADGEESGTDSPYQSARTDSPYQSARTDSPYQSASSESPYRGVESDSPYGGSGDTAQGQGLSATADGYRIRHPEPVTDVRVLR